MFSKFFINRFAFATSFSYIKYRILRNFCWCRIIDPCTFFVTIQTPPLRLTLCLKCVSVDPRPRLNRPCMPNFLVGLLNAVQAIEILWFKNWNSWSLLLTMRQATQHSKKVVFKSKIYLWNPHWHLWKGKGSLHGPDNKCVVNLFLV